MTLSIGDKAPNFTLLNDNDSPVTLETLKGKKIILFFYPKDMTPGCTKEVCDFRDAFERLTAKDVVVFGISKDKTQSHVKFKSKYALPFSLLSDPDGSTCKAYGVMKSKSMFGKSFLGIERATFLIDEKGMVEKMWRKVKVAGHVEQILNELN